MGSPIVLIRTLRCRLPTPLFPSLARRPIEWRLALHRAPRLITDEDGQERLQIDPTLIGSGQRRRASIRAMGRDGHVIADGFKYSQGAPAGNSR
jgi:hypothetical protein